MRYATEAMRPGQTRSAPPGAGEVGTHALLIFNYLGRDRFYRICPVFWSLAIEAQFYVVLPIACAAAGRLAGGGRRAVALVVGAFAAIGIASRAGEHASFSAHYPATSGLPTHVWLTSYLDLFAAGMARFQFGKNRGG